MSYYHDPENAKDYVRRAKGYDGAELIAHLQKYLPHGASVLELGMGPGTDLDILAKHYKTTGSDNAPYFLNRYRALNPNADLLELDAISIDTPRRFDSIYSNKVLHHLNDKELDLSFINQAKCLHDNGLILHSFWLGDEMMEINKMIFYYRQIDDVRARLASRFELIDAQHYSELAPNDSFWILARKR